MIDSTTTASILDNIDVQNAMNIAFDNGFETAKALAWEFIETYREEINHTYTEDELSNIFKYHMRKK